MIHAILTGSRVYGTPKKKSDLDVAMLLTKKEMALMRKMADEVQETDYDTGDTTSLSLRFGRLNVIALTCPVAFAVFQKALTLLGRDAPVSRDDAVARTQGLRMRYGIAGPPKGTPDGPDSDTPF